MTSIKVIIDDQPLSISEVEQVLKQKSNANTADKEKIRVALEKSEHHTQGFTGAYFGRLSR